MSDDWPRPLEFKLWGGPQDGAKVHKIGPEMPGVIYVGRRFRGDGYAAWGREKCNRFPIRYDLISDDRFMHVP